jgi:hypothetical protein
VLCHSAAERSATRARSAPISKTAPALTTLTWTLRPRQESNPQPDG